MIVRTRQRRRAFSLMEVLMAIFIMGIGVIAIAALFPAGIAQQRQSVDDVIGPIVANNALSVLRLKLESDDFGTFEEFGVSAEMPTIEGDWPWLRPGIDPTSGWYNVFSDGAPAPDLATEFFSAGYTDPDGFSSDPTLHGIPYNTYKWPANPGNPPRIVISQGERYYPTARAAAFVDPAVPRPRPQYVWDCMFRRFQGKILVAIFVYRVQLVGGDTVTYAVPPSATGPPIPHHRMLVDSYVSPSNWNDAWDVDGDPFTPEIEPIVDGTGPGAALNLSADNWDDHWQAGRQWLLDQNNNVYRVLAGRRTMSDGPVELVRAISEVPLLGPYFVYPPATAGMQGSENVVAAIWYIPTEVNLAGGLQAQLTPVYVTVREL